MNKPTKEFEDMVAANKWHENLDEIVDLIKKSSAEDAEWSWIRNSQCKYISLRFDMRDGAFVLLNRKGERISLEQLKYQYTDTTGAQNG